MEKLKIEEGIFMKVREGLIPTALGTAVTVAGAIWDSVEMKKSRVKNVTPMIAAGIVGFGLAHVVLGTIDLVEHKRW